MTKDEKKMKAYVIEEIRNVCKISIKEAEAMVDESTFLEMLKNEPQFVMHYSVEYWVKEICDEYE